MDKSTRRRRTGARRTASFASGLLAAATVALPLRSHSAAAEISAIVLVVLAFCGAWLLSLPGLRSPHKLGVVVALVITGELTTGHEVGRMPAILCVLLLAIGHWALTGQSPTESGRERANRPSVLGTSVVLAADITWLVLTSNAVTLFVLAAAIAVLSAARRSPALRLLDAHARRGLQRSCFVLRTQVRRASLRCGHTLSGVFTGVCDTGRTELRRQGAKARRGAGSIGRWAQQPDSQISLGVGVVVAAVTAPIFHRLAADPSVIIRGTNDLNSNLPRVDYISFRPFRMSVAHPLWFVGMKFAIPVLGKVAAVTVVHAVACGTAAGILVSIARSRWDDARKMGSPLAIFYGLGYFALESPAVLIPRTDGALGRFEEAGTFARGMGYFPLHQWGTPTIVTSLPLAFAVYAMTLRLIADIELDRPRLRRHGMTLTVATVALTLLQPATTLALAPAVPVYLLLSGRFNRTTVSMLAKWTIGPGVAVVIGQVWFLASGVSPLEQAQWLWRPFWILRYFGLDHAAFWLMPAFVLLCAAIGGRRFLRNPAVALASTAFAIAMIPFLFLEQTTVASVPDGDLGVPPLMAMILLFMSALRFFLLECQAVWERSKLTTVEQRTPIGLISPWIPLAGLFLVAMLCAGVVDLLGAAGAVPET